MFDYKEARPLSIEDFKKQKHILMTSNNLNEFDIWGCCLLVDRLLEENKELRNKVNWLEFKEKYGDQYPIE